ncbi:MAG: BamA/TamA family outer membrane protein [Saprospiraceae bacterium]|nr:BamA/TamA family outer membrane protein [Saprospiraceae bacterium]
MNHHKFNILFALSVFLCSCNTTRLLQPNELLLKSNKIEIENFKSLETKVSLNEQLSTLYKQKPNRNYFLFVPREHLYYKYVIKKQKDNWITKTLAKQSEKPSILDTSLCTATRNNIYNYLFNMGYFAANCRYEIKSKNQKASVTYYVNPGERYIINDIQFLAEDSSIQKLLEENQEASFLKPGNPLDNSLFQSEKARISELLFNNGFVEFNPIYIQTLDVDTIHLKANIKLNIINPEFKSRHTQFTVNKINVNPNYKPSDSTKLIHTVQDSIDYLIDPENKFVKLSVISSKIGFRPNTISNKSYIDETYDKLSRLGIYRFVTIEPKIDSLDPTKINYNILLTSHKKWVFDFGADLNYTSIKTTSKTLFGVSGFVLLKNRNLFKGAESFTTKFEVGTELNLFNLNKFNSLNFHYSNELSLPSFYDITASWRIARFLFRPFTKLKDRPDSRTNLKIGADYENLVELYKYTSFNTNIEYEWQISRRKRVSLHTLGFFLYLLTTTDTFNSILKNNPFLENSFKGRRILTSFFLDNFTFYYQSKLNRKSQHALITNFNISGLEVQALNNLYKFTSSKNDTFSFGEFEFSKFIRGEIDYRFYYSISEKSRLATRFSIGYVSPFGFSNSVPYIKQFYVGGPQSLRAWNIREIGPGSYNLNTANINNRQTYFAAGDIKLESSIEFRFDVIWRFKGAFFIDAGNIWLLPDAFNEDKKGIISKNLLNEIAIGTGLGVRLDLSYFLFRIDAGFKLRNPYETEGKHWIYSNKYPVSLKHLFENYTLHLALDYPF